MDITNAYTNMALFYMFLNKHTWNGENHAILELQALNNPDFSTIEMLHFTHNLH